VHTEAAYNNACVSTHIHILTPVVSIFFLQCSAHPPDLHSFPTRRSSDLRGGGLRRCGPPRGAQHAPPRRPTRRRANGALQARRQDRKSTRLNSSHLGISYAVFCLKKKKILSSKKVTCSECY